MMFKNLCLASCIAITTIPAKEFNSENLMKEYKLATEDNIKFEKIRMAAKLGNVAAIKEYKIFCKQKGVSVCFYDESNQKVFQ